MFFFFIGSTELRYKFLCLCFSFTSKESWSSTRTDVSKVSIPILMRRCEFILSQFLRDENGLGKSPWYWSSWSETTRCSRLSKLLHEVFAYLSQSLIFLVSLTVLIGELSLPSVRVEETICVLRELACLVIDYKTATILPLQPSLKVLGENENPGGRAHLFFLFPSLCELVATRCVFHHALFNLSCQLSSKACN